MNQWLRAKLTTLKTMLWLAKELFVENKVGCLTVFGLFLAIGAYAVYEFLHKVLRF